MARAKAVAAKELVDVSVSGYTTFCADVRRPRCMAENDAAKAAGSPWTQEDRVECLRPCDSDTAELLARQVRIVVAAQVVLWHILAIGEGTPGALDQAVRELQASLVDFDAVLAPIKRALSGGGLR